MEDQIMTLLKRITGEDEYIFDSINGDNQSSPRGFLSNRFSFWLDINSESLTVASDKYSVTWEIGKDGPIATQITELEEDGTSITTIMSVDEGTMNLSVRLGRLTLEFADDEIVEMDSFNFGNTTVDVPRGWANYEGPLLIDANNSNKLIHDILGRPLDKTHNERLTIRMAHPVDNSDFILLFTDGKSHKPIQERSIEKYEMHDQAAVIQVIKHIIGDY